MPILSRSASRVAVLPSERNWMWMILRPGEQPACLAKQRAVPLAKADGAQHPRAANGGIDGAGDLHRQRLRLLAEQVDALRRGACFDVGAVGCAHE